MVLVLVELWYALSWGITSLHRADLEKEVTSPHGKLD